MEYNNPLSELASTHPAFAEMAAFVWVEHVKRRPAIDRGLAALRLKSYNQTPKRENDRIPLDVCHPTYSRAEIKIFTENGVNYCGGGCGENCKYLETSPTNFDTVLFHKDNVTDCHDSNLVYLQDLIPQPCAN